MPAGQGSQVYRLFQLARFRQRQGYYGQDEQGGGKGPHIRCNFKGGDRLLKVRHLGCADDVGGYAGLV